MTEDLFSGCHSLPAGTCLHGVYEVQETIGAGGFAITYRGVRKDTGEVVAIKEYFPPSLAVRNKQEGLYVLRPFPEKNAALFQKGLRRFMNEAGILRSFQNLESIVPVYDMFEENGTAYLVMEFIDGLTLSRYVAENGTLTFPEISELVVPVIRALASVHARGLVHRDISPDNLILGMDHRLHLIDFGAAGSGSAGEAGNRHNTVIIKAGYAPPEQYVPNGRTGAWTDVYAICATIYFCVTGDAPAEAVHRLDDAAQPLPRLKQLLPWQYAILEKGLQLRPADRFQSARELCAALAGTSEEDGNATIAVQHDFRGGSGGSFRQGRFWRLRRSGHFRHSRYSGHSRRDGESGFDRMGGGGGFVRRVIAAALVAAATGALIFFLFHMSDISGTSGMSGTAGEKFPGAGDRDAVTGGSSATNGAVHADAAAGTSPPDGGVLPKTVTGQPGILVMPDVTGITLKKAKKKIHAQDASIQVEVSYVYDAAVGKGRVVNQSIAKGVHFSEKQIPSVSLTVSKGKKPPATSADAAAATPEPEGQAGRGQAEKGKAGKTPDYKVKGDDGFVSVPFE